MPKIKKQELKRNVLDTPKVAVKTKKFAFSSTKHPNSTKVSAKKENTESQKREYPSFEEVFGEDIRADGQFNLMNYYKSEHDFEKYIKAKNENLPKQKKNPYSKKLNWLTPRFPEQ